MTIGKYGHSTYLCFHKDLELLEDWTTSTKKSVIPSVLYSSEATSLYKAQIADKRKNL